MATDVLKEPTGLRKLLRKITYMQLSLSLLVVELGLLIWLFILAVKTNGELSLLQGSIGILCLIFSVIGAIAPLYGHFIVQKNSRISWKVGVILQGIVLLFLVYLYFLGI